MNWMPHVTRISLPLLALSACLTAFPATATSIAPPAAPATAKSAEGGDAESAYQQLRSAVVAAAQAERWDEAIAKGQKLLAMSLPTQNPYTQMYAADLLFMLLHRNQQHAQAITVVDQVLEQTRQYEGGPIPGQVEALVQRGVLEAVMAQDGAALDRYLQTMYGHAEPFAGQWQWDAAHHRVQFQTAQLTLPTVQGRWVLNQIEPAKDRDDTTTFHYLYAQADGKRMRLRMALHYEEAWKAKDAAALQQALREEGDYLPRGEQRESQLTLPALPWADATQHQAAHRETSEERPDLLHLHWRAVRGNWHLHLHAELLASQRDTALQQLPLLWKAMDWPQAPDLPAQLPQREQAVTSAWRHQRDWSQAGALARAALPDAVFPTELARLHTVAGMAAFKAGQDAEARRHIDQALQAWPHASNDRLESELRDNAQQYGAALAVQQGQHGAAAALMRQYLRNAGGLQNIWFQPDDPQAAVLENRRTGMVLPMWLADFHMQEPLDQQRLQYRDLRTEFTMGLTTALKIPASDAAQEKLLRQALEKQFRVQAGKLTVKPFRPQVRAGRAAATGKQWTFAVQPKPDQPGRLNVSGRPKDATPQRVVFWVVDQGGQRSILRATIANAAEERRAQQLAQALPW